MSAIPKEAARRPDTFFQRSAYRSTGTSPGYVTLTRPQPPAWPGSSAFLINVEAKSDLPSDKRYSTLSAQHALSLRMPARRSDAPSEYLVRTEDVSNVANWPERRHPRRSSLSGDLLGTSSPVTGLRSVPAVAALARLLQDVSLRVPAARLRGPQVACRLRCDRSVRHRHAAALLRRAPRSRCHNSR